MALVKLLKIGADGLRREHDAGVDSLDLSDVLFTGVSLGGSSGATVLGDDSTTYSNISPAGDTIRETLDAIDSALGTLISNECLVSDSFTNKELSAMSKGDVVYISGNDEIQLADADDNAKDEPIGIVIDASIAADASGKVVTHGCAPGVLAGATAGVKYFLDTASGAITTTPPTGDGDSVVLIGYALNATDLFVRIETIAERDD